MERFTDAKGRKKPMTSSAEAYRRLAKYEKTGYMPEDVERLICERDEITKLEPAKKLINGVPVEMIIHE